MPPWLPADSTTVTSAPTRSVTVCPESACVSRLVRTVDRSVAGTVDAGTVDADPETVTVCAGGALPTPEAETAVGAGTELLAAEAEAAVGAGTGLLEAALMEAALMEAEAAGIAPDLAVAQPAMPATARAATAATAGTHVPMVRYTQI